MQTSRVYRRKYILKIGIVTVHDSANYGSYLQAYALYHVLEKMGHEVYFIRSREKEYIQNIFCPKMSIKNFVKHPIGQIRKQIHNRKKFIVFQNDWQHFRVLEKWNDINLDRIILGSDEIWNVRQKVFRKGIFYGIDMKNVMSYAISMGAATKDEVTQFPELVDAIKQVNPVLVRDRRTQQIVQNITGVCPEMVCDPTFLLPVEKYTTGEAAIKLSKDKKYLLVYSYSFSKELKEKIIRFAKENELTIISAGLYHSWCDEFINASPLQFCEVLNNVEYVVTTTFHGTIFSLLNHKKFVVEPFSPKVTDVLEKVGLECAMLDKNITYEQFSNKLLGANYNYELVDAKVMQQREDSLNLLKHHLGSC